MEYQLEERRRLECELEIRYCQLCGAPELPPPFFRIEEKEEINCQRERVKNIGRKDVAWKSTIMFHKEAK